VPITTLISMASVFGLLGLAVYLARRQRLASFCILWFFINLVIESSVVPLEMVFEHRVYLPMLGPALLASWLLFTVLNRRPRWAVAIAIAVSLLLATGTYQRNHAWMDEVTLWADAVDKSPLRWRSQYNLGHYLEKQGRYEEAVQHYREALRIQPNYAPALNNLAWVLATAADDALRDGAQAVELAGRAARMTGHESPNLLDTLAAAHAELGQFDLAVQWQQKAVEIAPQKKKDALRRRLELYNSGKPFREASREASPAPDKVR
jgi:tetratricopeptide (TPR) repeat protein